ncbi:MAG: DUF4278 domain-containing protein [Rhodobacteraceae bacterium]|nr:DUF4278 domain-containing protein [Paracoccaceae bacterium]
MTQLIYRSVSHWPADRSLPVPVRPRLPMCYRGAAYFSDAAVPGTGRPTSSALRYRGVRYQSA